MKSYTILYADDDQDDIMLISEAFEKYTDHLRVIQAYNGFEALQTLEQLQDKNSLPCLIILDINMPIMDGKETAHFIKTNDSLKDIPVILFTTSNNPHDKLFAENMGVDFITKPVRYLDMETLVKEFVSKCGVETAI